jgi:hypothetical protein
METSQFLSESKKKFVISVLVARYGGGHYATYDALRSIVEQKQLPWDLRLTDVGEMMNQLTEQKEFLNAYKLMGTTGDEFYAWILQSGWTWIHPILLRLNRFLVKFNYNAGVKIFAEYWREQQPDMVLSTLPIFNKGMWDSLQQSKPGTPAVTLLIDLADIPPGFWIEPETGNYLICGNEKAVEQARCLGVKEERIIQTSGMVIHPRFYEPMSKDRRSERERLGLDPDCLTGLVLFGGFGSQAMLEIAKRLECFHEKLQLIFICGRNEELANALRESQGTQKRFVIGFTQDIPYYMHLSDFFIGKPGPGSISEALVMNLPVIVQRNFATLTQEKYNTEWIEHKQLGLVIPSFRNIAQAVEKFLLPENFACYRANVAAINNQAVFEIPDILQKILATSKETTHTAPHKQRQ